MHICYECRGFFPREDVKFHYRWGLICEKCFNQKDADLEEVKKL